MGIFFSKKEEGYAEAEAEAEDNIIKQRIVNVTPCEMIFCDRNGSIKDEHGDVIIKIYP